MRIVLLTGALLLGCSSSHKPYSHYLLDPQVIIPEDVVERPEKAELSRSGSDRTVKSRWNDGQTYTEIDIPVLASGQRIVIEHRTDKAGVKKPGPRIVLPAPSSTDTGHLVMHNAYISKGFQENPKAPEISLSQARIKLDEAVKLNNHGLALQIIERTLDRYPSHPEFLRAKGSVLLLLGEKEKAIETYESAQDLEPDPSVDRKLRELNP
ncbi:tetratricopeptide repeat protein [Oligoflexus tunisiensis]|uniref:tetratricopeptide repeat protein n=1 Tax=Oligoflexus tunisiensis TaxID=708132 RepID=UPI00114CCFA4|nr:tetratricopeptide repeat protein [Oligoflexus tunisiensis]